EWPNTPGSKPSWSRSGSWPAQHLDGAGTGRDNSSMSSYWPTEDGWPYPDGAIEPVDTDFDVDEDLLTLRERSSHLLDNLEPLKRTVISARFGLAGQPVRSMKQLRGDLHLPRADIGQALGTGLAKLRRQFGS